jgi:hypothetical protein
VALLGSLVAGGGSFIAGLRISLVIAGAAFLAGAVVTMVTIHPAAPA